MTQLSAVSRHWRGDSCRASSSTAASRSPVVSPIPVFNDPSHQGFPELAAEESENAHNQGVLAYQLEETRVSADKCDAVACHTTVLGQKQKSTAPSSMDAEAVSCKRDKL
jgi:hypothetical protein